MVFSYGVSGVRLPTVALVHKSAGRNTLLAADTTYNFFFKNHSFSRRIFAGEALNDSESRRFATSKKVLVPGGHTDGFSSSTHQLEVSIDRDSSMMEPCSDMEGIEDHVEPISSSAKTDIELEPPSSLCLEEDGKAKDVETSVTEHEPIITESDRVRKRTIPPPGTGQRIYEIDPMLTNHRYHLDYRYEQYKRIRAEIDKYEGGLEAFSRGYKRLGFTCSVTGITYREWAPGAKSAALIGDFNNWNANADVMTQADFGYYLTIFSSS